MRKAVLFGVALCVAATGMVTVTWIGNEQLIDSIPYPDGGAVVIQEGETYYKFTYVSPDGCTSNETSMIPCTGQIDTILIRASGRYVHLTVEGNCGVNVIRYELPRGAAGLKHCFSANWEVTE